MIKKSAYQRKIHRLLQKKKKNYVNTAIHSTWCVCGNISTGCIHDVHSQPHSLNNVRSLINVVGLQDIYSKRKVCSFFKFRRNFTTFGCKPSLGGSTIMTSCQIRKFSTPTIALFTPPTDTSSLDKLSDAPPDKGVTSHEWNEWAVGGLLPVNSFSAFPQ